MTAPSRACQTSDNRYRLVCSWLAGAATSHGVPSCRNIWMCGCAGTMCYKHWRDKRLNPSGFRVVSREYPHEPVAMYKDLRCASPRPCHAGTSQNTLLPSYTSHGCVLMRQPRYSPCI